MTVPRAAATAVVGAVSGALVLLGWRRLAAKECADLVGGVERACAAEPVAGWVVVGAVAGAVVALLVVAAAGRLARRRH